MARPECDTPLVCFGMCIENSHLDWPISTTFIGKLPKIELLKWSWDFDLLWRKLLCKKLWNLPSKQNWLSRRLESLVEQKAKLCARIEHGCVCYIANYKLNLEISLEWTFSHQVSSVISLTMISSILQLW